VSIGGGDLDLHVMVTNLLSHELQTFEGSQTIDRVGRASFGFALPEWRSLGTVRWSRGAWAAGYAIQWIGDYTNCSIADDGSPYCAGVPSVLYHDVDASYEWNRLALRAGVNNLSDEDPPFVDLGAGNTNPALYRLLGRSYFLQLAYRLN
jgi:outer membrane receptor protein involved in Fe transport